MEIGSDHIVSPVTDRNEAAKCWPLFQALRPHLQDQAEFLARWQQQSAEGYRLAFVASDGVACGALGYRLLHTMAWGRIVYVDDLIVAERCRGSGHGTRLLQWVKSVAKELGCDAVHLDTGYGRHAAHALYLKNGFTLNCHHMEHRIG